MGESLAGQSTVHHPDRQLVADQHDVAVVNRRPGVFDGCEHPIGDPLERFTPARTKRVDQVGPVAGLAECPAGATHRAALKVVGRLDDALIGVDRKPEARGNRLRRFLHALQGGGDEAADRAPALLQVEGCGFSHFHAKIGESIVRQASIKHAFGIEHFSVTDKMHLASYHGIQST